MKSHLSPYSNDTDVCNDMQKIIRRKGQALVQNKCFCETPTTAGASKFGDGACSGPPFSEILRPTCTDHTLMSGQPVLHSRYFLAIPSARPSRFDFAENRTCTRSWRLQEHQ